MATCLWFAVHLLTFYVLTSELQMPISLSASLSWTNISDYYPSDDRKEVMTGTLKVILATTKVILAIEEVITATLNVILTTTKVILANEEMITGT